MLKVKASLERVKEGEEVLAPLGMGFFAPASLSKGKVFVPVGGGYYLLTSIEGAKKVVEEGLENAKKRQRELAEAVKKAEEETIALLREAR